MARLTDIDGIDGPFERAMSRAEREDRRVTVQPRRPKMRIPVANGPNPEAK